MRKAVDRIMEIYALLKSHPAEASPQVRAKVTDYLTMLFEAGERDAQRLAVCGLTYLRELDGSIDPVKSGYTGL
ncbi:MAG: hypothetical protein ACREDC_11385 [Bradyrhizobium sp.]